MEVILNFRKNSLIKLGRIFCATLLFAFQIFMFAFGANEYQIATVTTKLSPPYPYSYDYKLKFKIPKSLHSQTLSYLSHKALQKNLEKSYKDNITELGPTFFENLINTAINRELDFQEDYYVFYHGQKLEFMLMQDLFTKLYEVLLKKTLNDFFILRVPNEEFKQFKKIKKFVRHYKKTGEFDSGRIDHKDFVKTNLLSVNPSLFSNKERPTSCSFYYFLNSRNSSYTNTMNFIKNIFEFFKIQKLYEKYQPQLQNLEYLLSGYSYQKTGLLLQIFIPKEKINDLAYMAKPGGNLYYPYQFILPTPKVFDDLNNYQQNIFSSFATYINPVAMIDKIQLRLLVNDQLLDPANGCIMFRYFNETANVKEYQKQLNKLMALIAKDLKKKESYS